MENEPQAPAQQCCQNMCSKKWHGKHRGGGHGCGAGGLWFIGWLFTIGFLHLSFWKGVLALVIWPYYIGTFLR